MSNRFGFFAAMAAAFAIFAPSLVLAPVFVLAVVAAHEGAPLILLALMFGARAKAASS